MIRNLEIENCYSFLSKTDLSFKINNKAPDSEKYQASQVEGERVAKVTCIVGANGSGKSNLLRVISFLRWFLIDSFGDRPDEDFPLMPFLLKEKPYGPAKIKIEFETQEKVFRYNVEIEGSTVLQEDLELLDLEKTAQLERKRFKQLFSRTYSDSDKSYEVKASPDFSLSEGVRELVKKRENASLISAALFTNHEQSKPIKDYWSNITTKIKQFGERRYPLDYYLFKSSEFYYKNNNFKVSMEEMMSKSDLGLIGLEIQKVEVPDANSTDSSKKEFFMPYGRHRGINGQEHKLPFLFESTGTQQIFVLLSSLLPVLESGGLAIIDELEADLHPNILPALLELFTSKKINQKCAQLIFTCHATPVLRALQKYQIVIVDKNDEGISRARRLDELEGVRIDDNFYEKYTKGEYGGIPNVKNLSG